MNAVRAASWLRVDAAGGRENVLTAPRGRGLSCAALPGGGLPPVPVPCVNQEVRTLMTVAEMGVAHRRSIVPAPVVAG